MPLLEVEAIVKRNRQILWELQMNLTQYRTEYIEMGRVHKEHVYAYFMPRVDWMWLVESTLAKDALYDPIREDMIETAKTMPSYPMGEWIDNSRGCGCVVGEYLIAHDICRREDVVNGETCVMSLIDKQPNEAALVAFGQHIDMILRNALQLTSGCRHLGHDIVVVFKD